MGPANNKLMEVHRKFINEVHAEIGEAPVEVPDKEVASVAVFLRVNRFYHSISYILI
jgi:hypothetical protein